MRRFTEIGAGLYVLALVLPALVFDGPLFGGDRPQTVVGLQCLLAGVIVFPAWIANPLLLVSWFGTTIAAHRMWVHKMAVGCATFATIAAVAAPMVLKSMDIRFGHAHVGYVAWLLSCLFTAIGAYGRLLDAQDAIQAAQAARLGDQWKVDTAA